MCVIKIDADPQPLEHNSRQMLLPSGSWFLHRTVKKIQGNLSWVFDGVSYLEMSPGRVLALFCD